QSRSFDDVALYQESSVNLSDTRNGATPERIQASDVTASLLPTLGVSPLVGRNFTEVEDQPRGPRVVIISEGIWRRRFAGDRSVIGQTIDVDGAARTVVGVMPS